MPTPTPFLWFPGNAEEAIDLYLSVFREAKRPGTVRAPEGGPWPEGTAVTISFQIGGQQYIAFNGGPGHPFTDAVSLSVSCGTQAEIDEYWTGLLAGGGQEIACGWLKDRFGLCWQIVPDNIGELIKSPAAMKALMGMTKLDKAALEAAAREPAVAG